MEKKKKIIIAVIVIGSVCILAVSAGIYTLLSFPIAGEETRIAYITVRTGEQGCHQEVFLTDFSDEESLSLQDEIIACLQDGRYRGSFDRQTGSWSMGDADIDICFLGNDLSDLRLGRQNLLVKMNGRIYPVKDAEALRKDIYFILKDYGCLKGLDLPWAADLQTGGGAQ